MDQPDRSTSTAIWLCNSSHFPPTALVPGWYMISLKTTTLSARMTGTAANRRKRSAASPPTPPGSQGVWERGGIKEHAATGTSVIGNSRLHHAGKAGASQGNA